MCFRPKIFELNREHKIPFSKSFQTLLNPRISPIKVYGGYTFYVLSHKYEICLMWKISHFIPPFTYGKFSFHCLKGTKIYSFTWMPRIVNFFARFFFIKNLNKLIFFHAIAVLLRREKIPSSSSVASCCVVSEEWVKQ